MDRIYILYHGSLGELVTEHLVASGFADRMVCIYDLKVAAVSLDDPARDLPPDLPLCACDLILVLGILPKAGDLVPLIAEKTGARAVLWALEDPNLIPEGRYTIAQELEKRGIALAFMEPLCTLDRSEHEEIQHFAESFGTPRFEVRVNPKLKVIERIKVLRDTPCGSASKIAAKLIGTSYENEQAFEEKVVQLHDNECVAYMGPDRPLMQQAGRLLLDALKAAIETEERR